MIKAFINLRRKQIGRIILDLGLLRMIFLTFLLGGLGFYYMRMFAAQLTTAYYLVGLHALLILLIQIQRQDKLFLKSHFNNHKLIYLTDYLLLTSPILICLIYFGHILPILLIPLVIACIVHLDIKWKKQSWNTKLQQLIPSDSIEWKAGVRKLLLFIVPVWMIGMATSFFIGSVPIVIFILSLSMLGFYEKSESYQMIIALERSSKSFLFYKIKRHILLFSALTFPLILAFVLFHPNNYYIPIFEYLIFLSLHIYFILTKYAFYDPNRKSAAAQTFGILGSIGALMLIFLPVVWLLSIRFYFQSIQRLNLYLSDFN